MSHFLFSRVFPVSFFVVGAVLSVWQSFVVLEARESSSWPAVEGKVLSKKIETSTQRGNNGRSSDSWRPVIQFSYVVDGKTYQGTRLRIGNPSYGRYDKAENAIADFSFKKTCTV
ncbi:DUF3592 domain-containing protein [Rubripirellula sp.]|nr:DUF3592 domain-containing protein [Rubripirellula sp.]